MTRNRESASCARAASSSRHGVAACSASRQEERSTYVYWSSLMATALEGCGDLSPHSRQVGHSVSHTCIGQTLRRSSRQLEQRRCALRQTMKAGMAARRQAAQSGGQRCGGEEEQRRTGTHRGSTRPRAGPRRSADRVPWPLRRPRGLRRWRRSVRDEVEVELARMATRGCAGRGARRVALEEAVVVPCGSLGGGWRGERGGGRRRRKRGRERVRGKGETGEGRLALGSRLLSSCTALFE